MLRPDTRARRRDQHRLGGFAAFCAALAWLGAGPACDRDAQQIPPPAATTSPPPAATIDDPVAHVVKCDEAVDGQDRPPSGRIVLDRVAFPPSDYSYDPARRPYGYFAKFGLDVRGGTEPVRVLVPAEWRGRLGIMWGNRLREGVELLEFEPCSPAERWKGYAGGVSLRRRGCVPLTVEVGGRRETIELGIGRRCPSSP
jgi:hypothetical protein